MSDQPVIRTVDRERWSELLPRFDDCTYQQTAAYADAIAARDRAQVHRLTIEVSGALIGAATVRVKALPVLGGGLAYVAAGPLVRHSECDIDEAAQRLEMCLAALHDEYTAKRGLTLRILGPLGDGQWNQRQAAVFARRGFVPSTEAASYRTFVVDLSRPLEEIRRGLHRKWRNHLRQAEKNGLTIQSGCEASLFARFLELYGQMQQRKSFRADLSAEFYAALQPSLEPDERFTVSLAETDGRPVAGHVASRLGDGCIYLLGASSEQGLPSKASYLLQWHTMQQAKDAGCTRYDLGGIDPAANPGVYEFKKGLRGEELTAPGPFELPAAGLRGVFTRRAERIYRRLRAAA